MCDTTFNANIKTCCTYLSYFELCVHKCKIIFSFYARVGRNQASFCLQQKPCIETNGQIEIVKRIYVITAALCVNGSVLCILTSDSVD